jgi:hyaluronan synthase
MPIRVLGFIRMAHNAGWGTRRGGFAGQRTRSALLVLPYLLGGALLTVSVMVGV